MIRVFDFSFKNDNRKCMFMDFLLVDLNKEVYWFIFINGLCMKIYEICRRYFVLFVFYIFFFSNGIFLGKGIFVIIIFVK